MKADPKATLADADILVVDDTIESLQLLTEILTRAGYRVRPADGSQVALESAMAYPPDLILLDVRMPGMSGFEVCRRLKQDARTTDIPVIFVSALQDVEDRVQGFESGGMDFISKPIERLEVLARVKTHLELRAMQLRLEAQVAHRTADLTEANQTLRAEITEHKKALEELEQARAYTDHLIQTANVMIISLDLEARVVQINPTAESITGYTVSEVVGKNWFEFLVPRDRYPEVYDEFNRIVQAGLPRTFENPIVTRDGQERFIAWRNSHIRQGETIIGITSFGIDITERKQAEARLKEREAQFRALVEQSPLSIQIFNPDGQIIQVNKSWEALWGVSGEALQDVMKLYNVLEDQQAEKKGVLSLIKKAFQGEAIILPVFEYDAASTVDKLEVGGAEARKRFVQARFYPIKNDQGKITRVVGIEEDITGRKRAEQEILQYQQRLKALAYQLTIAEEKERRVIAADLHDNVGHSLALARMQMNSILESESKLERTLLVKDISNIMLQALQETRSLMFDLSSPSMNEIGLSAAISEWLDDQIVNRYGLKTEFIDTIEDEHRITLDENVRALLFRNVRELLTNVVKHARAKNVSVQLKEKAHEVHISIEDDGVGFDTDTDYTTKDVVSGFGLFSIQERMTDLGGAVDIQSAPGKGCRVVLRLPVGEG